MAQVKREVLKEIDSMIDKGPKLFIAQAVLDAMQATNTMGVSKQRHASQSIANSLIAISLLLDEMSKE